MLHKVSKQTYYVKFSVSDQSNAKMYAVAVTFAQKAVNGHKECTTISFNSTENAQKFLESECMKRLLTGVSEDARSVLIVNFVDVNGINITVS